MEPYTECSCCTKLVYPPQETHCLSCGFPTGNSRYLLIKEREIARDQIVIAIDDLDSFDYLIMWGDMLIDLNTELGAYSA